MTRYGNWMQTFSGRQFWPMDPRAEEVSLVDIAHSLSMQCRFAGHCIKFYSVAEHCCLIHDAASDANKAWGLLHDASEAYLVDVPRPVKPFLVGYKDAENAVTAVIMQYFGLDANQPDEIKELDGRILKDEAVQNMLRPPVAWDYTGEPLHVRINLWSPDKAKTEFLDRARSLGL